MKKCAILIGFVTTLNIYAQAPVQSEAYRVAAFSSTLINNKVMDAKGLDPTVQGSPYLNNDFKITNISNTSDAVTARYNIFKDEVEFKKGNDLYILPKNDLYRIVKIQPNTNLVLIDNKYYIVLLENNNVSLLKREKVEYQKGREATNGYETSKLSSYKASKPSFYIKKNDKVIEIDKKTNFEEIFSNKNANSYIKTEKIDLKNEASLLKLMRYLTS